MPPPRRRPQLVEEDEEDVEMQDNVDDVDDEGDEPMDDASSDGELSSMIKSLVRYALACEFSRTPIRREGIREKVMGPRGRAFKKVFAGAQKQLRATFGMEMVELPARDRSLMTAEQKRRAAKSQSQKEPASKAYVLVSVLPEEYRSSHILTPSKVESADGEAAYISLYTTIITIITLSGGELSDARLRRHLSRLNIAENMPSMNPHDGARPSEKTDVVLQRMVKQGYLVKVTESRSAGDDEGTMWYVGPRGKVEVPKEAIANFVRAVYDDTNPDLEKQLETSLKIKGRESGAASGQDGEEVEEAPPDGDPGPSVRRSARNWAG